MRNGTVVGEHMQQTASGVDAEIAVGAVAVELGSRFARRRSGRWGAPNERRRNRPL